jgi:hypothetical protein
LQSLDNNQFLRDFNNSEEMLLQVLDGKIELKAEMPKSLKLFENLYPSKEKPKLELGLNPTREDWLLFFSHQTSTLS